MKITHPVHGDRTIPDIDWTPAWRVQGWRTAVDTAAIAAPAPTPPIGAATLYKLGETPQNVPEIDVPGWLAQGWSKEPPPPPEPAAPSPIEGLILNRISTLEALYEAEGWDAIKSRGDAVGVTKDTDGWKATIPAIAQAEIEAEQ